MKTKIKKMYDGLLGAFRFSSLVSRFDCGRIFRDLSSVDQNEKMFHIDNDNI